MNPADFVALGLSLAPTNPRDPLRAASCRTAISRSYYGAHHLVVAALAQFQWFVAQASYGHDEAQEMLKISGHPTLVAAGVHLANLYDRRHQADYKLHKNHMESHGYALSSWDIALEVQKATEAMLSEPLRPLVAEAIATTAVARWMVEAGGGELPRWRPLKRDKKKGQAGHGLTESDTVGEI